MLYKIVKSPNYSKKNRKTNKIKFLVIHYTGMQSKRASIKRLTNSKSRVSCHYLISRDGKVIQMLGHNKVAWHAGKSRWQKLKNLNIHSIGIELVNKGHRLGYQNFSKKQINSLVKLCLILKKKYQIKISNILGHSDIAPLRKLDPGEKFPWLRLSKSGLSFWYKKKQKKSFVFKVLKKSEIRKIFFANLFKIGYRYFNKNKPNKTDKFIIRAFQMRFLQENVTGDIDQKTLTISHYLTNK
jgi:N-acetylmuramoyl-L-alanine amidase